MNAADLPLDAQFARFRAEHRVEQCQHANQIWRHRRIGQGDEAVLWLTGALGAAELGFQSFLALGPQFTIIAPDYPPTPSLDAFCDGLIAILNQEGDPLMPEATQVALRTLYPTAETHRFSQGGHSISMLDPETFVSVIRQFISQAVEAAHRRA